MQKLNDDELERIKREKLRKLLEKMERGEKKMEDVKHLTSRNFQEEVIESEIPVIIDFWAEWCMPCKIVAPIFEELAKEYAGKMKFAKVNVDENPDLAATFGIHSIPTFLIFHKGKVVEKLVGAMPKDHFKKFIDHVLSSIE